jgi:NAD(P)H-nitrite reductase large subunit
MIKSVTIGLCVLACTGSFAFAETGPGQAKAPGTTMHNTDPMNANARMHKKKMKKSRMMKSGMSDGNMSGGGMSGGGMSGGMKKDGMGGMAK